ncbi:hypothetical protein COV24_04645 [candidate division WWE3 bacterium CG10_big_fil_rev_8_21_14_0_10_32_10]|uniref:Uncharacterized protein n=1 Tax=candidate division WWE3 bacterium CG10_big_fil_rev_8_21_14_0_10_32_10 TaxID=1975090 RepID=A0A2H0R9D9_UNCKA|nr:MAG: hypothetical protein COV24_04645 [candidate division WWE3 bacterium CG10_big_fil_rev_8_21_14_0_10_32_10]
MFTNPELPLEDILSENGVNLSDRDSNQEEQNLLIKQEIPQQPTLSGVYIPFTESAHLDPSLILAEIEAKTHFERALGHTKHRNPIDN